MSNKYLLNEGKSCFNVNNLLNTKQKGKIFPIFKEAKTCFSSKPKRQNNPRYPHVLFTDYFNSILPGEPFNKVMVLNSTHKIVFQEIQGRAKHSPLYTAESFLTSSITIWYGNLNCLLCGKTSNLVVLFRTHFHL